MNNYRKFFIVYGLLFSLFFSPLVFASQIKETIRPYNNRNTVVLNAVTGAPGQIDLSWTSTNPDYYYQIQKSYNGINFFNISNVTGTNNAFTNSGLYSNVHYWYRLIARNPDGSRAEFSNLADAISTAELPTATILFQDYFDARTRIINPAWYLKGGRWRQKSGRLEQIDHTTRFSMKKAILVDQHYPIDQTITAKVRVTGISGSDHHIGVGTNVDHHSGWGYELVFSNVPGDPNQRSIQFIKETDEVVPLGNPIPFAWKTRVWYWFKLMGPIGNTLYGKVWEDGTPEPINWLTQVADGSMNVHGSPALDGGNTNASGNASAVFDEVTVTSPTAVKPLPFSIGGDSSVKPSDFHITTFASGLNFPHGMQQLSDKSILVATSDPLPGGNYFSSTGTLLRFTDTNHDGIADGPGQVKYSGLPGTLTSLKVAGNLVFVTSSQRTKESIWVLRMGPTPMDPYTLIGSFQFHFPNPWNHTTYALAVRHALGGVTNVYELFFNVGSQFNSTPDIDTVNLSGLLVGVMHGSSIYSVKIHDMGSNVIASDLTQIADGLRNAAGMTFDPNTGDLYFEDNGIDIDLIRDEPLSADTLHRIISYRIGTRVFHFGYPHSYIAYRSGKRVGPPTTEPLVAFQPWPNAIVGSESEGAAQIAMAPPDFPFSLNKGVFVGFHGRFNLAGIKNEENPLVFFNRRNDKYFHFIGNEEPNIGHLDGLLSTRNALFVADLCKSGDPSSADAANTGVIYKIKAR